MMRTPRKRKLVQKAAKPEMGLSPSPSGPSKARGYAEVLKGEFPSLSNNSQLNNAGPSSMWSTAGSRNLGGPIQRNQPTPISSQQSQDELFTPTTSSRPGGFRFGNQGTVGQPAQSQQSTSIDDFPPLNRNANGEIGGERSANLMSSLGFGSQGAAPSAPIPSNRVVGNGLLNALSANVRAAEARSPTSSSSPVQTRTQDSAGALLEDENGRKPGPFREESLLMNFSGADGVSQSPDSRASLGALGNDTAAGKTKDDKETRSPEVQDPLAGMTPVDKFGIKGLRALMNNYPSYGALIQGVDPSDFGLNVNSPELISTQIWSLFDDTPPRPSAPNFRLPECYQVTNVQPIETKIQSFNEETLFWIFYSCPQDIKQQLAAVELHSRNWRWHKKLHFWLTKDEMMMPHVLSPTHERGYYIIWDTATWRKERRELTLHYGDLDTTLGQPTA